MSKNSIVAVIVTPEKSITVCFKDSDTKRTSTKSVSAGSTSTYQDVLRLLKNKASGDDVLKAMDLGAKIRQHPSGLFNISEDGKTCYIGGEEVHKFLGDTILSYAEQGLDFARLVKFWENCKANPDPRAKTDLFAFLSQNGHPITEDGCFVAYRAVRNDFMDKRTGNIHNGIGAIITMERSECDADPARTCSTGLHAASYDYAHNVYGSFYGDTPDILLDVKIDPKNVVSVPIDYSQQKLRCCEYLVLAENEGGRIERKTWEKQDSEDRETISEDELDDFFDEDESSATSLAGPIPAPQNVKVVGHTGWKTQERDSNGRFGRQTTF